MKPYYLVRAKGKQHFWLSGPYAHIDQAEAKKPLFNNTDVVDCPDEFITQSNFDNGDGFVYVATSLDNRSTLYGSCEIKFTPRNVI